MNPSAPPVPPPLARRGSSARARLACGAAALLVVLGAALLIAAPTVLLSSHAQSISATSQPTLRTVTAHAPLETVVPSQGTHIEWRLKPTAGVIPASSADAGRERAPEHLCARAPRSCGGRLGDVQQTRAPPG